MVKGVEDFFVTKEAKKSGRGIWLMECNDFIGGKLDLKS
jgi:predicted RNA-binding protein YlxR (DUF448 family)